MTVLAPSTASSLPPGWLHQQRSLRRAPPLVPTLIFTGNEVMRAEWQPVENADGYRVTIYQEQNGGWVDTGFGYDLDKDTTAIDMALTVGGEETEESKKSDGKRNLQGRCKCLPGAGGRRKVLQRRNHIYRGISAEVHAAESCPFRER